MLNPPRQFPTPAAILLCGYCPLVLERVWEKNQNIFRCIVGQILFDRSSTDDVLQEAYARTLQAKKAFTDEEEAHRYLRRVVWNTAIDYYRRFSRQNSLIKSVSSVRQESPNPLTILIREEETELEKFAPHRDAQGLQGTLTQAEASDRSSIQ